MKIAYVSNVRLPTEKAHGIQIVRMCEAFSELGAEVTLFHPRRHQPDPGMRAIDPVIYYGVKHAFQLRTLRNIDIYRLYKYVPGWLFRGISFAHTMVWERYAANAAATSGSELFYFRDSTPVAAMRTARSGLPTVLEFHELPTGTARAALRKATRSPGFKLAVCVTKNLAEDVGRSIGVPAEKILVAHDGVDAERFFPVDAVPRPANRAATVIYAGSLLPNRGVDTLVNAAALLPEVKFEVIGGIPEQVARFRTLASECGVSNIAFSGQIPHFEVPGRLAGADVLALPMTGKEEHTALHASPMKLFEYIATGIPIVASDLPSIREVLTHSETAWLCKPDDPRSLADGINAIMNDTASAREMSARARLLSLKFTWRSRAELILERAGLIDGTGTSREKTA